ncbi:MAG: hypothetical protein Q9214_006276, partial [Letrouitia sp. 1 TL-2023]
PKTCILDHDPIQRIRHVEPHVVVPVLVQAQRAARVLQEQVQQARLDVLERRRQRGRDVARDEVGAAGVLHQLPAQLSSVLVVGFGNTSGKRGGGKKRQTYGGESERMLGVCCAGHGGGGRGFEAGDLLLDGTDVEPVG